MRSNAEKPLGMKAYGSIPHVPGSRRGPSDKGINEGQFAICSKKFRDANDCLFVQEKLDGSNVAVAKIDSVIVPLIRAGYRAESSRYVMHRYFADWVYERQSVFSRIINDGERLCGEWLAQAHGTRYELGVRSPFVAFDIMEGSLRAPMRHFNSRVRDCVIEGIFGIPPLIHEGPPLPVEEAMSLAGEYGRYGASDQIEGVVYRVERSGKVDFLAKYVRPDKVDGCYLACNPPIWNWLPETHGVDPETVEEVS